MSHSDSDDDPLGPIAESFLARIRAGQRPSLTEYAERYPELADRIQAFFPVMVEAEQLVASEGFSNTRVAGEGPGPEQLGDYRITREVGRGGMGIVYEAIQESLGRRVALKVLPRHGRATPKLLERFRREARAAARLHHTNIVPVIGVGEADGVHYYAMQFINGQGLDVVIGELQRLRDGPAPPASATPGSIQQESTATSIAWRLLTGLFAGPDGELTEAPVDPTAGNPMHPCDPAGPRGDQGDPRPVGSGVSLASALSGPEEWKFFRGAARLGMQVAEALAYAHGQGILHRDIKPANLLIDLQSIIWITDFGLAKAEGGDDLTQTGDIVGTLRYMAPERFDGRSDQRSDIYSLGATLYELLTLRPPFRELDRVKLIEQVLHDSPTPPRKLDRYIPRDLETIVLKAMAKEPGQRYTTAAQMAEDLRRFAADRPILARRISAAERTLRWCKRNPMLAGAVGVVAAALVAVTVISVVYSTEQAKATREITGLATALGTERESLKKSLAESNRLLAIRNFDRGQAAFEKGEVHLGMLWMIESWRSALEAGDPAWQQAARTNLAAWRPHYPRLKAVFSHPGPIVGAAFSPDGSTVISGGMDGTARLWNAASGKTICSPLHHGGEWVRVAFSPDGRTVLTCSVDQTGSESNTARLWDGTTGQSLGPSLHLRPQVQIWSAAFHPDGRLVLTGLEDNVARLWDLAAGKPIGPLLNHQILPYSMAFSPDGKSMLTGSADGIARHWDTATGKPIGAPMNHRGRVWSVAFSPDGRTIATSGADRTARLWEAATGKPLGPPLRHESQVRCVAFNPDGKSILTGCLDKDARLWDAATGQLIGLLGHQGSVHTVAFSPDGKSILTGSLDGTLRLWDADPGKPIGKVLEIASTDFVGAT